MDMTNTAADASNTCTRCKGEGTIYDPTMANYVGNAGTGCVPCSECQGRGVTTKLTPEQLLAEMERHLATSRGRYVNGRYVRGV